MRPTPPAPPTDPGDPRIQRMRALATLLDSSIPVPGTGFRFGLDAVIGLVPGIGDATGAILSGYLVLQAARMGASPATLARMVGNVAVETVVGAVPFLGDLFDAAWKANRRNMRLLEAHLLDPRGTARASRGWVIAVVVALLVVFGVGIALLIWIGGLLLDALGAG